MHFAVIKTRLLRTRNGRPFDDRPFPRKLHHQSLWFISFGQLHCWLYGEHNNPQSYPHICNPLVSMTVFFEPIMLSLGGGGKWDYNERKNCFWLWLKFQPISKHLGMTAAYTYIARG